MVSHRAGLRLRAILAVGALISFMSVAHADGLPEPYRPPPVAYERPYGWWSWSGFYIGANAGYAWSPNDNQLALLGDFPTGFRRRAGSPVAKSGTIGNSGASWWERKPTCKERIFRTGFKT